MNARLWILIAGLVAALGCADSHGGVADGAVDEVDATVGEQDSGPDCVWDLTNGNNCKVCAADATCGSPKYTDHMNGTVMSSCCGLVWQQVVDDTGGDGFGGYTFDEAKTYCEALTLAGAGWRLPTMPELFSLVVLGQTPESPPIDRVAFPNTPADSFWSSSPAIGTTFVAWSAAFSYGGPGTEDMTLTNHVRCVR